MATENVNQEAPQATLTRGIESLLPALMQKALPALGDEDLRLLSGMTDDVECMLGHMSTTAESVGNLVCDNEGHTNAESTSRLLYMFANYSRHAEGILQVAKLADTALFFRERHQTVAASESGANHG